MPETRPARKPPLNAEVSNRRPATAGWSAQGASELPPGVERTSGAAVGSTDLVGPVSCTSKIDLPQQQALPAPAIPDRRLPIRS